VAVAVVLALGGATACGADDDETVADGAEAPDGPGDARPDAGGDGDEGTGGPDADGDPAPTGEAAACPDELFSGTVDRTADESLGHTEAALSGADVVDGVAYEFLGAYTIYLADHEIDRAPFAEFAEGRFSTENAVTAEPDGVLVYLGIGDYGPGGSGLLEVGSQLDAEAAAQIAVLVDSGGGAGASIQEPTGTVEVLGIEDDRVCVEVDYRDDQQVVEGTVSVPLHEGGSGEE
jgi:hypothetical protein